MDASDEKKEHQKRATARIGDNRHLMRVSLQQGSRILAELQRARQDQTQHAKDDAEQFAEQAERHARLALAHEKTKTDVMWMRRIGAFITTALGIGHFFK